MKTLILILIALPLSAFAASVGIKDTFSELDIAEVQARYSFTAKENAVLAKMLRNKLPDPNDLEDVKGVYRKQLTPFLEEVRQPNGRYLIREGSDLAVILGFQGEKLTGQEKIKLMSKKKFKRKLKEL